jgi:hypothetical protein
MAQSNNDHATAVYSHSTPNTSHSGNVGLGTYMPPAVRGSSIPTYPSPPYLTYPAAPVPNTPIYVGIDQRMRILRE